jgi:alkanesulfonate monooxygenase SsuD/methylene tetrahydromethanopterin reductase-like flavin-dependent oxidoreductase (luciferase family)
VIGTANDVADAMEEWMEAKAADGFNITPTHLPHALNDFAEHVLPELRRRGRFREEYEGQTLRQNLGLQEPRSMYA